MKTSWPVKKLGEVSAVLGGGTPRRSNSEYWNGDIPWMTMEDAHGNFEVNGTAQFISDLGLKESNAQLVPPNSVILSCTASIGTATINRIPLSTNQQFNSFHPTNEVLAEYMAYRLIFDKDRVSALAGSTTFPFISKTAISNFQIPVPSIQTQNKIAERLDAIRKAQDINDLQISKTEELFESVLEKELSFNKDNDDFEKLGELVDLANGRAFKTKEWATEGLPIIRIQNLNDPTADFNYYKGNYDNRHLIKSGDLLFSWSGSLGTSFGAHIWDRSDGLLNQHIFKIRIKNSKVQKDYLYLFLQKITKNIEKKAHGGAGLVHVTKTELDKTPIKILNLKEQEEIVEKLSAVQEYKKLLLKQKTLYKDLFDSVLDKSMKGEMD